MAKLDRKKVEWITRERKKAAEGRYGAFTAAQIAKYAGVTGRRVKQLWAEYRAAGRVPVPGVPGRPRPACWDAYAPLVTSTFAEYRCGSVALGRLAGREQLTQKCPERARKAIRGCRRKI